MSNYFRSLNRIEEEEEAAGVSFEAATAGSTGKVKLKRPTAHLTSNNDAAFVTLFDNLRALANGRPVRSLVLAGASTFERLHRVTEGLVRQVTRRNLSVIVAELTEQQSHPILRLLHAYPQAQRQGARAGEPELTHSGTDLALPPESLSLDLRGGPIPSELKQWIEQATAPGHLLVIEGPPLGQSLDGALVARACDGLVIIVEPEATPEDALRAAVERARAVGCRVLGLVMNGTQDYIPGWVRRLAHAKAT